MARAFGLTGRTRAKGEDRTRHGASDLCELLGTWAVKYGDAKK
jgi:hypothetical protein